MSARSIEIRVYYSTTGNIPILLSSTNMAYHTCAEMFMFLIGYLGVCVFFIDLNYYS